MDKGVLYLEAQQELFSKLVSMQERLTKEGIEYWKAYSDFSTWQFWFIFALLIGPLILLFFKIDRKNIFFVGFYGFAVHVLFAYVDAFGIRMGLWAYPYQLIPFLPSFSLDAAIIPIVAMLVFQWTYNRKKNFYLYAFLTALVFGFGFKPFLVSIHLFEKYDWINYIYIFIIYIVLFVVAYWMTKVFLWLHHKSK
jgi:hypothetical protein